MHRETITAEQAGLERSVPPRTGFRRSLLRLRPPECVLIHQPGKVGSSSLYYSLLYALPVPVFQTHAMNRSLAELSAELVRDYRERNDAPVHTRKARAFIHRFLRPGRPFACVTMIRDPIARNVSAFFENIADFPELADTSNPPPVERYREAFLAEWDHEFADRWFDFHLRHPLGPDWYAQPFDPRVGHRSIRHGKSRFLLMQLELPDETKERVLRRFLRFRTLRLDVTANVGERKAYAETYKRFKALPLPVDYLDRMCASRIATHFYTPEQMAAFRAKWE